MGMVPVRAVRVMVCSVASWIRASWPAERPLEGRPPPRPAGRRRRVAASEASRSVVELAQQRPAPPGQLCRRRSGAAGRRPLAGPGRPAAPARAGARDRVVGHAVGPGAEPAEEAAQGDRRGRRGLPSSRPGAGVEGGVGRPAGGRHHHHARAPGRRPGASKWIMARSASSWLASRAGSPGLVGEVGGQLAVGGGGGQRLAALARGQGWKGWPRSARCRRGRRGQGRCRAPPPGWRRRSARPGRGRCPPAPVATQVGGRCRPRT